VRLDHLLSKESHRLVRLVCAPVEGCVSLLSLIPHLIMQPFPVREGVVGVAGWNTSTAEVPSIAGGCHVCGGGRRRARTLLGPEKTPCEVVLGTAPGLVV
jgi:hypothetical protein